MWVVVRFIIWVILTILAIDFAFELVSMPNTFLNLSGLAFLIAYGCISYKTCCLTFIKIKKDEKN